MKSYTITVNGNVYDVTVEETGSTPSAPVKAAAPAKAPAAAPAPAATGHTDSLHPGFALPKSGLSSEGTDAPTYPASSLQAWN